MENGYLTNHYLIERYLSWEGRCPENRREVDRRNFCPVTAERRTCYSTIRQDEVPPFAYFSNAVLYVCTVFRQFVSVIRNVIHNRGPS